MSLHNAIIYVFVILCLFALTNPYVTAEATDFSASGSPSASSVSSSFDALSSHVSVRLPSATTLLLTFNSSSLFRFFNSTIYSFNKHQTNMYDSAEVSITLDSYTSMEFYNSHVHIMGKSHVIQKNKQNLVTHGQVEIVVEIHIDGNKLRASCTEISFRVNGMLTGVVARMASRLLSENYVWKLNELIQVWINQHHGGDMVKLLVRSPTLLQQHRITVAPAFQPEPTVTPAYLKHVCEQQRLNVGLSMDGKHLYILYEFQNAHTLLLNAQNEDKKEESSAKQEEKDL